MAPLDKLVPLSVMMLCGKPNRKITFFINRTAVAASHLLTGSASTHFVNLSTATQRCVFLSLDLLKGPTISSPQTANGQVIGISLNSGADTWARRGTSDIRDIY